MTPSVMNRIILLTCGVVLLAAGTRVAVPRVPVPLAAPPAARLPAPALPHYIQPQGAPQADIGKYAHTPTLLYHPVSYVEIVLVSSMTKQNSYKTK